MKRELSQVKHKYRLEIKGKRETIIIIIIIILLQSSRLQ